MNSDRQPIIAQKKQPRVISWSKLMPLLMSRVDNDRRIKLNALYTRFTRMEIEKVAFFQLTRSIVGDDKLMKMAIDKLDTPLVPSPHVQPQAGASVPPVPPMTSNEKPANEPCIIGRKKPLDALGQSSNKKRKVSAEGGLSDIEQLNDVTAVSGVDLREEEEKMFSGPKGGSRVSEASRKVAQEEEERLILEKGPLQKKLAEIMTKCGLKSASQDAIRCLSMCAEERLKGVISNSIRVSKQRADYEEKSRHRIVITSDVRQQIMNLYRKTEEELERKEAEKIQMAEEANKEDEISKLKTTAANVAARAAVGGADMLSKWQLMAQARQKCQGHIGVAPASQPSKDVNRKLISATRSVMQDNAGGEKRGGAAKSNRNFGRGEVSVAQTRVARSVSTKDVIAVLEREPQMAKSTLMYPLYERVPLSDTSGEQSQKCI